MRIVRGYAAIVLCLFALFVVDEANAQTQNISAEARLSWVLPTTATDGTPLTGANALTKLQVFAATAPIADTSAAAPTAELSGTATTWTYTTTVPNGSTLYFRVKACNAAACGPFSNEANKLVKIVIPGAATGLTVTVTVVISVQ